MRSTHRVRKTARACDTRAIGVSTATPAASRQGNSTMANSDKHTPHMLSGVRVLDFTQYLAGPTVTRFMAEMGAEIVKVEQAPMGDPARLLPAVRHRRSAYFLHHNRGKPRPRLSFS